MLPQYKRLNLKKDFRWVAAGRKLESKYARLFLRNGENLVPRIGIATSSKSFKKATERNRARRLLSSAIQLMYGKLPNSLNIVALPKIAIISVKSYDVLLDIERLLTQYKVIHEESTYINN